MRCPHAAAAFAALSLLAGGGAAGAAPEHVPFDSDRWTIRGEVEELTEYQGRTALRLHNGAALLDVDTLENGIIEFDIAFTGQRGFAGAVWRLVDLRNFEYFYVRPHQSGNPDANQYTPVFNGIAGWQLYHGEGYSAPLHYPLNEWIHVKLEFWEKQAQFYINDMDTPAVRVPELKRPVAAGRIGVRAQNAPVHISGFSYRPVNAPPFEPLPRPTVSAPAGVVTEWEVSSPFDGARLRSVDHLQPEQFAGLDWQVLESEASGITNLASLHGIADGRDTVFARTVIHSDRAQVREMRFGYSDRVKVYANGRAVYAGENTYRSRDYRYLGTIGLFDAVFLPLEAGRNEVWFAVSEAFGGWGIIVQLEDQL